MWRNTYTLLDASADCLIRSGLAGAVPCTSVHTDM